MWCLCPCWFMAGVRKVWKSWILPVKPIVFHNSHEVNHPDIYLTPLIQSRCTESLSNRHSSTSTEIPRNEQSCSKCQAWKVEGRPTKQPAAPSCERGGQSQLLSVDLQTQPDLTSWSSSSYAAHRSPRVATISPTHNRSHTRCGAHPPNHSCPRCFTCSGETCQLNMKAGCTNRIIYWY